MTIQTDVTSKLKKEVGGGGRYYKRISKIDPWAMSITLTLSQGFRVFDKSNKVTLDSRTIPFPGRGILLL